MKKYQELYRKALLEDVVPFWLQHSPDEQYGGYFSCLDRKGQVYDTDKFVWLQAREVWLFSMLYTKVEPRRQWFDMATLGADFLKRHGRDQHGNWYFSLNRKGEPLVQPYNIFADCFAAMAFGMYATAAKDEEARKIATDTYHNILKRQENPKGRYNKQVPHTRPLKSFALPMILSNLVLELEHILPQQSVEDTINKAVHEVMEVFTDTNKGIIYEHVLADGSFSDTFDGRLTNPGHGLEAMWFIMDIAHRRNRPELLRKAASMVPRILDWGWDQTYGGVFYFLDALNKPPQQLEWDQKLWWVHIEALVALSMAWVLTGDEIHKSWFEQVHTYTQNHFPDAEYGEWFAYLNRRGEPFLPVKGGKWKGCFHVPRGLCQIWQNFAHSGTTGF